MEKTKIADLSKKDQKLISELQEMIQKASLLKMEAPEQLSLGILIHLCVLRGVDPTEEIPEIFNRDGRKNIYHLYENLIRHGKDEAGKFAVKRMEDDCLAAVRDAMGVALGIPPSVLSGTNS